MSECFFDALRNLIVQRDAPNLRAEILHQQFKTSDAKTILCTLIKLEEAIMATISSIKRLHPSQSCAALQAQRMMWTMLLKDEDDRKKVKFQLIQFCGLSYFECDVEFTCSINNDILQHGHPLSLRARRAHNTGRGQVQDEVSAAANPTQQAACLAARLIWELSTAASSTHWKETFRDFVGDNLYFLTRAAFNQL